MLLKIIIWMNMPSHHQKDFFEELYNDNEIDLKVIYYENITLERKKLGWNNSIINEEYEMFFNGDISSLKNQIKDLNDRIHIIPGNRTVFLKKLLSYLIVNKIEWIHWSERSGSNLARLLSYNNFLFKVFQPLYLQFSGYKKYADNIDKFALGVFAQGILAKKDFIQWGVREDKIDYLFYVQKIREKLYFEEFKEYKKFIYVGSIDKRKGFDILLKAFSQISNKGWKLVIIGHDNSNGKFSKLVKKLKIEDTIEYKGVVPAEEVSKYMSLSDVFVFPSRFDGWGMVINEAISFDKAIISTLNAGATYHLVKEGQNGYILKSFDPIKLSRLMEKYIDDSSLLFKHQECSSTIKNSVSPKANVKRLKDSINKWKNK